MDFDQTFVLLVIGVFLIILVSIQYTLNKILLEVKEIRKNVWKKDIKNSELQNEIRSKA